MKPIVSSLAVSLSLLAGLAPAAAHASDESDTMVLPLAKFSAEPAPEATLFGRLVPADFPRAPEAVRFEVLDAGDDIVRVASFHRRGRSTGFAGMVTLTRDRHPESGLPRTTVRRVDEACLADSEARKLPIEATCASLVAVELMPGAFDLRFVAPQQNHRLRLDLVETRERGLWTLVPTGRRGEPARLELSLAGRDGALESRWRIADAVDSSSFERELSASLDEWELADARLGPIDFGLLSGLDFFEDLSDLHRGWTVYAYGEEVMDQPPTAGDDDDGDGCEKADGVCGAEYQTCIPTHDGWLGCGFGSWGPGWGGGLGGGGHGGNDNPKPDPDWQVGSSITSTPFPRPLFHGLELFYDAAGNADHYGLTYDMTSILQGASTTTKVSALAGKNVAHEVLLRFPVDDPECGGYFMSRYQGAASIPSGHFKHWVSSIYNNTANGTAGLEFDCASPGPGVHVLGYELDPEGLWNEGSDGEANNIGNFRGEAFRGYHIQD